MIKIKKAVKVERRSREVVQMQKVQTILGRVWRDIKNFRAAILALVLYNAVVRSVFRAFCPQLILTGFPCAGCGMTRAVLYILTGRFARGMQLNPAAPLWILFLGCFFVNRYVRGVYAKHTKLWLGVVCAATLAVYLYRMLNHFPGAPPLVYYRNNILRRIFMRL